MAPAPRMTPDDLRKMAPGAVLPGPSLAPGLSAFPITMTLAEVDAADGSYRFDAAWHGIAMGRWVARAAEGADKIAWAREGRAAP